jgi:hypothetical protein
MGMLTGMPIHTTSLEITPEILSLIAELDEFKGAWRALGTLAPERLSALRYAKHRAQSVVIHQNGMHGWHIF